MTEGVIKDRKLYVNIKEFSNKDINCMKLFLENKFKLNKINLPSFFTQPYQSNEKTVTSRQWGVAREKRLNNYYLEFNRNNIKKIYDIINPYILPSMKFKFIT